jgi:hypothetical protein
VTIFEAANAVNSTTVRAIRKQTAANLLFIL